MTLVEYAVSDRVGTITLNRPDKRNALSPEMIAGLHESFQKAETDPEVKVVLLRAKGEVFCSGADLEYLQQLEKFSFEENLQDTHKLKELFLKMYTLKKVVIAEVQGSALAGGCGLAMVCDFVFAVPEAKFGYTEVKIGFIPAIVMVFLLRKIGEAKSKELLLSGKLINATQAATWGMVNRVVEKNILENETRLFAQQLITGASAQSLMLTKQMIASVQHMKLEDALEFACKQNALARGNEDFKKGIGAFLNKQELKW